MGSGNEGNAAHSRPGIRQVAYFALMKLVSTSNFTLACGA